MKFEDFVNVFQYFHVTIYMSDKTKKDVRRITYPIDDENFVHVCFFYDLSSCDCYSIEETEAHGLRVLGVVTRRSYYGVTVL